MEIPKDAKKYELKRSTIWIDKDGIVYSVPNTDAPPDYTVSELKEEMNKFRDFTGNKKVCLVIESAPSAKAPKKDQRDVIADELTSVTKAMAIVTNSPLSRMMANLFFGFKPPKYPVKMFTDENEAKNWIRQYL